jgi:hypothetical protein
VFFMWLTLLGGCSNGDAPLDTGLTGGPRVIATAWARVSEVDGKLWFVSDTHNGVLTEGGPSEVEVVVRRVPGS